MTEPAEMSNLNDMLTDHMLLEVFGFLPLADLLTVIPLVCRRWKDICSTQAGWGGAGLLMSAHYMCLGEHGAVATLRI